MAVRVASPAPPMNDPPRPTGSVAKAAGIMMACVLLSRLLGMLRDIIIAHQFGASYRVDAYSAAFSIPDLLMYLIAGGALSSTFIPVFADYVHKGDAAGAAKTFSVVATVTFLVATVLVVIGEVWTPQLTILMNPGYANDAHAGFYDHYARVFLHPDSFLGDPRLPLAISLTRIVLPAQIFFMLGGLMMGTLNARNQFLVPALGPSIYNLGIIVGALLVKPLNIGIASLMWGALIGAFVGNFGLQLVYVRRAGQRYRPSLSVYHPGAVKVWRLMLPILLGVSLPNVDQIINKYFASMLSEGSQAAMQYAVRLMLIPIGVFAQAMGIAILPKLSAHAAAGERKELRKAIAQGLRTILFITIPASVLMYVLAAPIITLLDQHGEFTAADTLLTAAPLRFYALGIFAWSAQAILTRAFYAVQDSRVPVISGTAMTVLFILMNWFVIRETSWGISGLATATTVAATCHMVVMFYLLNRRIGRIASVPLLVSVVRSLIASTALCIIAFATRAFIDAHIAFAGVRVKALLDLLVASGIGIAAFLLVARVFDMPELKSAMAIVRRTRPATQIR